MTLELPLEAMSGALQGAMAAAVYAFAFYLKKRQKRPHPEGFNPYKLAATLVVGMGVGAVLALNGISLTEGRVQTQLSMYVGVIALVETAIKLGWRQLNNTGETS